MLDFIVKLPKLKEPGTGNVFNLIMVITNRLTKYSYFIPIKEKMDAPTTVYKIIRNMIANHELPREIILD